jgi:hypothetical protein
MFKIKTFWLKYKYNYKLATDPILKMYKCCSFNLMIILVANKFIRRLKVKKDIIIVLIS